MGGAQLGAKLVYCLGKGTREQWGYILKGLPSIVQGKVAVIVALRDVMGKNARRVETLRKHMVVNKR